jgi:hypothetical protein
LIGLLVRLVYTNLDFRNIYAHHSVADKNGLLAQNVYTNTRIYVGHLLFFWASGILVYAKIKGTY